MRLGQLWSKLGRPKWKSYVCFACIAMEWDRISSNSGYKSMVRWRRTRG